MKNPKPNWDTRATGNLSPLSRKDFDKINLYLQLAGYELPEWSPYDDDNWVDEHGWTYGNYFELISKEDIDRAIEAIWGNASNT